MIPRTAYFEHNQCYGKYIKQLIVSAYFAPHSNFSQRIFTFIENVIYFIQWKIGHFQNLINLPKTKTSQKVGSQIPYHCLNSNALWKHCKVIAQLTASALTLKRWLVLQRHLWLKFLFVKFWKLFLSTVCKWLRFVCFVALSAVLIRYSDKIWFFSHLLELPQDVPFTAPFS